MAQRDRLSSSSYPYVAVQVDIRGHRFEGSALVDTGFLRSLSGVQQTGRLLTYLRPMPQRPDGHRLLVDELAQDSLGS